MWLIIGLIVGAAILGLIIRIRGRGISVKWYEWLIGFIGLLLLLFSIQNVVGSFIELETTAAYMFLLVTGLPSLILLVVAWQLVARRTKIS